MKNKETMKKISKYLIVLMVGLTVISCEDFLQPLDDKPVTDQMMIADPAFMEGLLLHAYKALPNKYAYDSEAATDNAVTNVKTLNYLIINSGAWSSEYTPFNTFDDNFEEIYYINRFLANYKEVNWSDDPRIVPAENLAIADGHKKRLKGEAYGLRAWYEYQLLQTTSGIGSDNRLLGFPIVTSVENMSDEYKLPRNTFEECVQQILNDCDTALSVLPVKYVDIADNTVHNRTMGIRFLDRLDARGVM